MLIRSQDKTTLVNLNETFSLNIKCPKDTDLRKKYTIYAENEEGNRKRLGDYDEFIAAEDVLEEIEVFYNDKNSRHLIYPMPSDDMIKSREISDKKKKR